MTFTKERTLELADGALTWLEANPDRHTAGHLSIDAAGFTVDPRAEDAACFCVMGRMIHDSGEDGDASDLMLAMLKPFDAYPHQIAGINDRSLLTDRGSASLYKGPNKHTIARLRKAFELLAHG